MKKIIILSLCFMGFHSLFAQNLEEKIAQETCGCLEKQNKASAEVYATCIMNAVSEQVEDSLQYQAIFEKDEELDKFIKKVSDLLEENCLAFGKVKYGAKEKEFYADSQNKAALDAYIKGTELMNQKEYKKAIPLFAKAIKKDKKFVKAYDHLAICNRRLEKFDEALKYYAKSLEIFPDGDLALLNVAIIYSLKKDYEKALKGYEKLKDIHPYNPEGYFGLGKIYLVKEEYEKALENTFISHRMYVIMESSYQKDSETLIGLIYEALKKENKEEIFERVAKKYNIAIKN